MPTILPGPHAATPDADAVFAGGVPAIYNRFLVPLIFDSYAADLAARVRRLRPARVLEIAAGTGALTRALAATLEAGTEIVATDLNPGMLDEARATLTASRIAWQQADASRLPFADAGFECVACQFGAMFFPDKAVAFGETRRVLAPGGHFLFNVWDGIEDNEFADVVTDALSSLLSKDAARFLARTPHGYHDREAIGGHLRKAGFAEVTFETVTARSRAASARDVAIAYCQGTPLRQEIERAGDSLQHATDVAEEALAQRFGTGAVDGKIQALVVAAKRQAR